MEGPILNVTDFHFVGVLGRLGFRGSEDNSETPSTFVADTDVVVTGNTPVIITISDNIIFRMMRMGFRSFSCGFETYVSLANAQVAKPKMHGHNELSVAVAGLPLRLRRYDYLFRLGMLPLPVASGHDILYHIDDSVVSF
jgi:hypothetical protein